jgi:hypothetical protein
MEPDEWRVYDGPEQYGDLDAPIQIDPQGPCPGWIVRQPSVSEAAQAYSAYKDGAVELFFPDCENTVLEAAQQMSAAWNVYENARMKKLNRGQP